MHSGATFPGVLLLSVLTSLCACSGGSNPTALVEPPDLPKTPEPPDPESLAAMTRELTADERLHFVLRTSLGSRRAERDALAREGLANYVEKVTVFSFNSVDQIALGQITNPQHPQDYEITNYWVYLLMHSPNPLQEVMGLFWHDHFATAQRVLDSKTRYLYLDHIDLLRWRGNTNLRDLLRAVIEDQTVQIWLNGIDNRKGEINENLAREFWELFSLGIDQGYTPTDIAESARALTGYRLIAETITTRAHVAFDPSLHDDGEKTIFGITGAFGPLDIVDLTLEHRRVAEYICERIFTLFCYPNPPASIIDELAATLRTSAYQLRPVLVQTLNSEAFFSARSRVGRVKSPIEYVVGFARTTDIYPFPRTLNLLALNQEPGSPPDVGGWPQGKAWLKAQAVFDRADAIVNISTSRAALLERGFTSLMQTRDMSSTSIVDAVIYHLAVEVTAEERNLYYEYIDREVDVGSNGELIYSFDPFEPSDPRHVDQRLLGLIYILSQHPSYYLR